MTTEPHEFVFYISWLHIEIHGCKYDSKMCNYILQACIMICEKRYNGRKLLTFKMFKHSMRFASTIYFLNYYKSISNYE
jgi:hypothetical protein